tara:strand:- start:23174 stop:23413 length:240 start_codon:yes stop_codon:yes gene_type:complete
LKEKINKDKFKKSIDNLMSIYQQISDSAIESSKKRCPYKNARNLCTANFDCRNQKKINQQPFPICAGSDKLDYRSAWEL